MFLTYYFYFFIIALIFGQSFVIGDWFGGWNKQPKEKRLFDLKLGLQNQKKNFQQTITDIEGERVEYQRQNDPKIEQKGEEVKLKEENCVNPRKIFKEHLKKLESTEYAGQFVEFNKKLIPFLEEDKPKELVTTSKIWKEVENQKFVELFLAWTKLEKAENELKASIVAEDILKEQKIQFKEKKQFQEDEANEFIELIDCFDKRAGFYVGNKLTNATEKSKGGEDKNIKKDCQTKWDKARKTWNEKKSEPNGFIETMAKTFTKFFGKMEEKIAHNLNEGMDATLKLVANVDDLIRKEFVHE